METITIEVILYTVVLISFTFLIKLFIDNSNNFKPSNITLDKPPLEKSNNYKNSNTSFDKSFSLIDTSAISVLRVIYILAGWAWLLILVGMSVMINKSGSFGYLYEGVLIFFAPFCIFSSVMMFLSANHVKVTIRLEEQNRLLIKKINDSLNQKDVNVAN
jgi:hypothetical protein